MNFTQKKKIIFRYCVQWDVYHLNKIFAMSFISNSFGTILNRWPCQLYVDFLQNYVLFPNLASHWLCFICKSLNCLVSRMFYYNSLHSIPFYFLPIWIDLNFPLENQFHPFSLSMREYLFNHSFEYVPKPFVFCCMRVCVCAFVCVLKPPSSSHFSFCQPLKVKICFVSNRTPKLVSPTYCSCDRWARCFIL